MRLAWSALLTVRAFAGHVTFVADTTAPWKCHHYVGTQQESNWCETASFEKDGYEYSFTNGGVGGPCPPCWCCKRKAKAVEEDDTQEDEDASAIGDGSAASPGATGSAGAAIAPLAPATFAPATTTTPFPTTTTPFPTTTTPAPTAAPTAAPTQAPTPAPIVYDNHILNVEGLYRGVMAGDVGSVDGEDELTMQHGDGLTLFSAFDGEWKPDGLSELQLLGKMLSFTVDLSKVGCACNLALYLISSPGRDWLGKPDPGEKRGDQPPYYCDANKVGGQWCPELDIMQANNHVFQATLHKCDAPVNGHYQSCDRGGCEESTRLINGTVYGPGSKYTIDTTKPFEVRTEFYEGVGTFTGMRTTLLQGKQRLVLRHGSCKTSYFAKMSDAMAGGMSLRVSYWGDKAQTMGWMDTPPCDKHTSCSASNAGAATISNMAMSEVPVWTFGDPKDANFNKRVPPELVGDPEYFIALDDRGIVRYEDAEHFVHHVPASNADEAMVGETDAIMKKFETLPADVSGRGFLMQTGKVGSAAVALVAIFLLLVTLSAVWIGHSRARLSERSRCRRGTALSNAQTAGELTTNSEGASTFLHDCFSNAGLGGSPLLKRSGSSCQQLLAKLEGNTD